VRIAHAEKLLRRYAPQRELAYLDFGCGPGDVTAELIARLAPEQALGVDGTHSALALAARHGVPVRYADFRLPLELPFAPNAITSLDVLEHLDDPERALRHLAAAAAPRAALVVTVPALPSLHSRWDDLAGHKRRYTRRALREALLEGGWRPERIRYVFAYAVPAAWAERRLLRRVRGFEFPRVSRLANALLAAAGHAERRLGAPFPLGTSLVAAAVKP
jgi:SAM-dependent methyltransferase